MNSKKLLENFMELIENLFQIALNNSPDDYDVSIVSISEDGGLGELNQIVLNAYGFNYEILDDLNLEKGFNIYKENDRIIIFIVTVGINDTIVNLKNNLQSALSTYIKELANKKIWVPLMGTGVGKLTFEQSYLSIKQVLQEYEDYIKEYNCLFTISFPRTKEGLSLYNEVNNAFDFIEGKITIENAKKIIQDSKAKFYLAGSTWGSQEQAARFYKEGIWENGYQDGKYSKRINNIKVNDILIHKSTFSTKNGESILRIKAFGIVTRNYIDGRKVDVDWKVRWSEKKDFDGLGFYRDTISPVKEKDLIKIFTSFRSEEFELLYYSLVDKSEIKLVDEIQNTNKLAGLIADIDNGEDHLDIKKDVEAFARVIAAKSFQPPLAIALLGKWGSGKSFFMQKLKKDIQKLSDRNPQKVFCEGIAHIHFNAWSYMDANLWASIVTKIFEGLDEYINGLNLSDREKKEIEQQLFQKLTISKEEHKELEEQKKQVKEKLQELKTNKKNIKGELKDKINSIRSHSLKDILKKVDEEFKVSEQIEKALNENPTFVNSAQKFEKIIPKQYWENPTAFYNELKSINTFFQSFFRRKNICTNILWVSILIIAVIFIPVFLGTGTTLISWQDFTISKKTCFFISLIGAFFTQSIDTYLKLKKQIAPFWNIKEKYEKEKEAAIFKFRQEEKALKLEIAQKKDEIIQINNDINANLQLQASLDFKLKNILSTHALYSFIEKRANSDDYKKHLGIVSLIRKDFEILSGLLTDHKTELVTNQDSTEFKELFKDKKPLERIILYIDDLDRCPEERVVEVLEAVNLLMAFPLFVVVVGVDPRWIKKALQVKYKNQFNEEDNQDAISPSNYLEKIFQIPFHLKDAEEVSIKNMIEKLAGIKPQLKETIKTNTNEKYNFISIDEQSLTFDREDITFDREDITFDSEKIRKNTIDSEKDLLNENKIDALEITDFEGGIMQSMSRIIGNNPRAIKRFINIYRILKTHEDFVLNENDVLTAIFLIAFSVGKFSKYLKDFEGYINLPSCKNHTFNELKSNLSLVYSEIKHDDKLMNITYEEFNKQYQFIKRFTFKNI